jgi:hypothetical protein
MPLGDPMGGDTQYDSRGILLGVSTVAVPVRDLAGSVSFYEGTLGLRVQRDNRAENWVELGPIGNRFAVKPEKRRIGGLIAILLDQDGNQIAVVEELSPPAALGTNSTDAEAAERLRPKRTVTEY